MVLEVLGLEYRDRILGMNDLDSAQRDAKLNSPIHFRKSNSAFRIYRLKANSKLHIIRRSAQIDWGISQFTD